MSTHLQRSKINSEDHAGQRIEGDALSPSVSFQHKNINDVHDGQLTLGDIVADKVAAILGSWYFIIAQSFLLVFWIFLNTIAFIAHWDNYPYVLLNLALSFQAAFATPIILMSQNRQAQKDRLAAQYDFEVEVKCEQDLLKILEYLKRQDDNLEKKINEVLFAIHGGEVSG